MIHFDKAEMLEGGEALVLGTSNKGRVMLWCRYGLSMYKTLDIDIMITERVGDSLVQISINR